MVFIVLLREKKSTGVFTMRVSFRPWYERSMVLEEEEEEENGVAGPFDSYDIPTLLMTSAS